MKMLQKMLYVISKLHGAFSLGNTRIFIFFHDLYQPACCRCDLCRCFAVNFLGDLGKSFVLIFVNIFPFFTVQHLNPTVRLIS